MFHLQHEIEIDRDSDTIFSALADVESWPDIFSPTLTSRRISDHGDSEIIEIAALSNGVPHRWKSRRRFFYEDNAIEFEQIEPNPILSSMLGKWEVISLNSSSCLVRLFHDFSMAEGSDESFDFIKLAVNSNSERELQDLKLALEASFSSQGDVFFRSSNEIILDSSPEFAYEFIRDAKEWRSYVPHVASVNVTNLGDGFQFFELDTVDDRGDHFFTESYRTFDDINLCVTFKQTKLPDFMCLHNGSWVFQSHLSGSRAIVTHSVRLSDQVQADQSSDLLRRVEQHMHNNSEVTLKSCDYFFSLASDV